MQKETARVYRRKLEDNTKFYLKITGWDDMEGINLAQVTLRL
jgi:hypothetical protein